MKPPKCPRCGKVPSYYSERWTGFSMVFDANATGKPEETGFLIEGHPDGGVEARCVCGHSWRIRGAQQIDDVRERFADGGGKR